MRLGLGSYACAWALGVPGYDYRPNLDIFGLVRRASRLGLHVVQLADNAPVEALPASGVRELKKTASDIGVDLELGTRGIAPDHLRRMIELCNQLDSPILRIVVDTHKHEPSPDEIVQSFSALVSEFEQAGVTAAIENHDRFKVRVLRDIVERVASPRVGICLDTVNSFGSLEGPEAAVATLAPFVVNLHVKDFVVRRARHNMGFEITGTPAGEGQLDIFWLLSKLREAGRDPNAIIEHWPAPEATIAAAIEKEEHWCESSVLFLRRYIPD